MTKNRKWIFNYFLPNRSLKI